MRCMAVNSLCSQTMIVCPDILLLALLNDLVPSAEERSFGRDIRPKNMRHSVHVNEIRGVRTLRYWGGQRISIVIFTPQQLFLTPQQLLPDMGAQGDSIVVHMHQKMCSGRAYRPVKIILKFSSSLAWQEIATFQCAVSVTSAQSHPEAQTENASVRKRSTVVSDNQAEQHHPVVFDLLVSAIS